MTYLAIYDIAEPRRLSRVAKIMQDYGVRVQKSKFEIQVGKSGLREMSTRILQVIDPAEDGVKIIPLCGKCLAGKEKIGRGIFLDPESHFEIL